MTNIKLLGRGDIFTQDPKPWHGNYLSMYSSVLGGVVKDPLLMTIPIDDHMVHRGDGVFEVIKCKEGKIYQLDNHLERLGKSAASISLALPKCWKDIKTIISQTVRYGEERNCLIRLLVSRGPGGFTTNPFECPESQLYVVTTKPPSYGEKTKKGVSMLTSNIPIKPSYFANIKSCNYLPNVLMKREAVTAGVDYSIALDERGFLAEGSTESMGIVSKDLILKFPKFDRTLRGITLSRVHDLAYDLVTKATLNGVSFCDIKKEEAYDSREIILLGTTFDILPVIQFDGHEIGNGTPGKVYKELRILLNNDIRYNEQLLTPVWDD